MKERFLSHTAVLPVIVEEGKILLQLRQHTGFYDGYWDFAGSGHIEQGETATSALMREVREELGVSVHVTEKDCVHVSHMVMAEKSYLYFYFLVSRLAELPQIMEADKTAKLAWFSLEDLPKMLIPERRTVLELIQQSIRYSEYKIKESENGG
ncbi:NUDIX domain-containing protein [Streptococcus pneumoniae]